MKSMIKDAVILFIITIIAGAALGYVYDITKEPIALAEAEAAKKAYQEVFPSASTFEEIQALEDDNNASEWKSAGYSNISIDKVLKANDSSGNTEGYVVMVTTKEGYGGDISFAMGISNDATLNGISILSISETAGLGMRADEVLKPQFSNKKVSEFAVTKTGATENSQIDAISGATITSKAVTNAVNAGLFYFNSWLGGEA